jgi:hypothetical protein
VVGFDPAGVDRDRFGVARRTGNEATKYIEVPTRGLNGCFGPQGALADNAHAGPDDACIQA